MLQGHSHGNAAFFEYRKNRGYLRPARAENFSHLPIWDFAVTRAVHSRLRQSAAINEGGRIKLRGRVRAGRQGFSSEDQKTLPESPTREQSPQAPTAISVAASSGAIYPSIFGLSIPVPLDRVLQTLVHLLKNKTLQRGGWNRVLPGKRNCCNQQGQHWGLRSSADSGLKFQF